MPQPPPYERQADFTDFSAEHPDDPHSGVSLDAEFNAVRATLAGALANLLLIQRDDGALKNGIVGIGTLSAAVLALINASTGMVAGPWLTATAYVAGANWVAQGTATYFCAVSHTSGTFATDLAAGKWVLIYDSAGSTPADGSVTTAKVADGAITLAKLALTLLDLTGTIRAQGGLAAGTAAPGELLAGKRASGDVIGKVDRATKDQGIVGWKVGGGTGGVDHYLRQDEDSDDLELYDGAVRVRWGGGLMDVIGRVRATGDATPVAGAGIGLRFASAIGYLDSYDHDATAWRPAHLRASTLTFVCGGVTVAAATSTGINFPLGVTLGASNYGAGYLDIPKNVQSAAYTLAVTDRGKMIFSQNVAGQAITIPANADVALPVEMAVGIRNRGTNPITVAPAAGVTLRWAGSVSTGARTVATNGLAMLHQELANEWVISGAGVS
jgi:hypothetical protein